MTSVFLFGRLRDRDVLNAVLGAGADPVPASLPGFDAVSVGAVPMAGLSARTGGTVAGDVLIDLPPVLLERLHYVMTAFGSAAQEVDATYAGGTVWARAYGPPVGDTSEAWDFPAWQRRFSALVVAMVDEVTEEIGHRPPETIAARMRSIEARAAARLRAATGDHPAKVRHKMAPDDVEIIEKRRPYAHFFSVEEYDLRHRRFDGTFTPVIERAAWVSTDAVTVLPYDPVRDRVMLVEQFRMGPFVRGDAQVWSLEAIAGRTEPHEPPETSARREALEEAGLTLRELIPVANYYPSPGAKTEYLYSYIGLADLPDGAAGLGGLEGEGEDIRAHVLPFYKAMDLFQSGELENAPAILSLLWLARIREGLRPQA